MPQIPYIFNQLCSFIPRDIFDRLVKKHKGNNSIKHYTCWNHLMVMIWAQLTHRNSLRDIECSLRAHNDKIYRLGMGKSISRNNISYANAHRDVAVFRDLAQAMMSQASNLPAVDPVLRNIAELFGLAGFFAVDSSTVTLDLGRFAWSVPQEGTGGVKLHTMYDIMRRVPRSCLITGHEERDQTFMEYYGYERECFYMLDKMYLKTKGLHAIQCAGAYFVTRMKKNMAYAVTGSKNVRGMNALADQSIRFTSRWASAGYPEELRLVTYYSPENNATYKFLSNNFTLEAETIALLYKFRWEIECFFKWIKQHLRIVSFYGNSANAVMIQIYVGYITYCMLAMAASALKFRGSLYDFENMCNVSLTEKCYLIDLMNRGCNGAVKPIPDSPSLFDI